MVILLNMHIEPGNYVERITSSCLDNIDQRIVGLELNLVTRVRRSCGSGHDIGRDVPVATAMT